MAKARFFSDYERDVIRIGVARGIPHHRIATYLGRTQQGVSSQVKAMKDSGTLENKPFEFLCDDLARAMKP